MWIFQVCIVRDLRVTSKWQHRLCKKNWYYMYFSFSVFFPIIFKSSLIVIFTFIFLKLILYSINHRYYWILVHFNAIKSMFRHKRKKTNIESKIKIMVGSKLGNFSDVTAIIISWSVKGCSTISKYFWYENMVYVWTFRMIIY